MRILACGSRHHTDTQSVYTILAGLHHMAEALYAAGDDTPFTIIYGDATGADALIHQWATRATNPFAHPRIIPLKRDAHWRDPCRPTCRPGHRRRRNDHTDDYCPAQGVYRNDVMLTDLLAGDPRDMRLGVGFINRPLVECSGTNDMITKIVNENITAWTIDVRTRINPPQGILRGIDR